MVCIYIHIYAYPCTHTPIIQHFSVKKKGEILLFVTTWMDLEGIMLSEVSQTVKDEHCMVLCVGSKKKVQLKETNTNGRMVIARG